MKNRIKRVCQLLIFLLVFSCQKTDVPKTEISFYFRNKSKEAVYLTAYGTMKSRGVDKIKVGRGQRVRFSFGGPNNQLGWISFPPGVTGFRIEDKEGKFWEESCVYDAGFPYDYEKCNLSEHSLLKPESYVKREAKLSRNREADYFYDFGDEDYQMLK